MPAPLDRDRVRRQLETLELRSLFIDDLGWDHGGGEITAVVAGRTFLLEPLAQKRGFVAYRYLADSHDAYPDHPTRQKIERCVTRTVREHLIVYVATDRNTHCWQWVNRQAGRPDRTRTHIYNGRQSGEALIQKLEHLVFTLDEEDRLTILDPSARARAAFDVERVTKRFYDRFRNEHRAFLGFVEGIASLGDREWYASLMLNRMMFIYFIQKRRFLDDDPNYLRNRLERVRSERGVGSFHSFYRLFLLRLFHEGLGQPQADRAPGLAKLLGEVPYLNGGLFDVHDLERDNPDIHIPDEAFEQIFAFFESYQWHLDDRPLRNDNEINPDVLGYIFEKYVNQKQMGAYYTKEDITGYIARNTVIPFLFDHAREDCAIAFRPDGAVWRLLKDDPDRYFHDAMRHGITYDRNREASLPAPLSLPPEIAVGVDDASSREGWNQPAPPEYALPTETWREHLARRHRYEQVRAKLAAGEITSINDLVTYNLHIERFARDVIAGSEGPELVHAFWKALNVVSVLDPTCGSGAFLFAALNILEPLYNACLDAMQGFVDDLDRSQRERHPATLRDFRTLLQRITSHESDRYFILKSIIIGNLYGVDIMEEAVEICKLRLFLKLVAQLERYDQIEPLPDIDFNIRAGNALVGFASRGHVERTLSADMLRQLSLPRIAQRAEAADHAFRDFRIIQTERAVDAVAHAEAKLQLRTRLRELRQELNEYLASDYGVKITSPQRYRRWLEGHQPFHWFVEFYGVMRRGGFDVIIGNPPYRPLREVTQYSLRGYDCEPAGNLYAVMLERFMSLSHNDGRSGFIVPVSSVSTDGYACLQEKLSRHTLHYSSFDDRPSRLFDGLQHVRLTIHLIAPFSSPTCLHSTKYNKWNTKERAHLFSNLSYVRTDAVAGRLIEGAFPKLCSDHEASILAKLNKQTRRLAYFSSSAGSHCVYYTRKIGHFVQFLDFVPRIIDGQGRQRSPSELKVLRFNSQVHAKVALCCFNSSLFYWFMKVFSDCRNVNKREVDGFPMNLQRLRTPAEQLVMLADDLMSDLHRTSEDRQMRSGTDVLTVQCVFPKHSKHILDGIDTALADHYGFADEELDFIISYDIKYRMGVTGGGNLGE